MKPNYLFLCVCFCAISVDMQDFSQLSSKMVTEVLMLEIKMAPAAKAYLISGFPRSMRDVVEYSDKVRYGLSVSILYYRYRKGIAQFVNGQIYQFPHQFSLETLHYPNYRFKLLVV